MSPDLELAADRRLLGRTSTVERLADILRSRIIEGFFAPGERLAEDSIGSALGVSRNTLREAFRLLTHERLLVHELNRGVFVCKLTVADLIDVYRVRKIVECGAVRNLDGRPAQVGDMAMAVSQGEEAMRAQNWRALGTANMVFHQSVAAVAGSPRVDELMRGVLAELRLHFHSMSDPRQFHEPYLERNREILKVIESGDGAAADRLLHKYLDDSERQLVEAYRAAAD